MLAKASQSWTWLRAFRGRGTHDDVLPNHLIAHTAQWLPDHADLSGRVYQRLTHSISEAELNDVGAFLTTWRDSASQISASESPAP